MKFENFGPFVMPRDTHGDFITSLETSRALLGETIRGEPVALSEARGCYVFAMRSARGTTPWYVGKASKTTFSKECFNHKNRSTFQSVTKDHRGTPLLYLIALMTPTNKFAGTYENTNRHIDYVEKFLITAAYVRNPKLINIKIVALYRDLIVPGIINSERAPNSEATESLKKTLGL